MGKQLYCLFTSLCKTTFSALLASLVCAAALTSPVQARLGENIDKLRQTIKSNFTSKGDSVKDNRHYYMFTMNLSKDLQFKVPGFTGGLTITTLPNGTITGQSMLMYMGKDQVKGRALATVHALDFALESLGRPVPNNPNQINDELQTFGKIIEQAMDGKPQNIRYPNVQGKVTVSKQPNGGLILAATQE